MLDVLGMPLQTSVSTRTLDFVRRSRKRESAHEPHGLIKAERNIKVRKKNYCRYNGQLFSPNKGKALLRIGPPISRSRTNVDHSLENEKQDAVQRW